MSGTPPSQKDRPLAFALEVAGAITSSVTLALRPEDFTRADTSRTTVHHTLGGAFADSFGPGLPTIQLSGHTGWRGGTDGSGEDRWRALRDDVFNGWHAARKAAIDQGRDPAEVRLLFADFLHDYTVEVAPMALTLRRSRSRPLLIQYQMTLTVLDQNRDQLDFLSGGGDSDALSGGGFFASVMAAIGTIRGAIQRARAWVSLNLAGPVRAFLSRTNAIFGAVIGTVRDARALVGQVIAIPLAIAQTGHNLFRTLAAVASLPLAVRTDLMRVAGAYTDLWCFLLRARSRRLAYAEYDRFFGASGCSSISGGRPHSPLAGTNAWEALPQQPRLPGVSVSVAGRNGLLAIAASDPALRPLDEPALELALRDIEAGIQAAAA